MPIRPDDPLLAPSRGSVADALSWASRKGAKRIEEVDAYLTEVYRLAPLVGLDAAIVVSQSAEETSNWTSDWWVNRLNPAGIGITGDPTQNAASKTWVSGTDAARAHVVHLAVYVGVTVLPYKDLDPRYNAAIDAGFFGIAETINDLTGRWAVDPHYAANIAVIGTAMFPGLTEGPPVALNMTKGLIPLPPIKKSLVTPQERPEGVGWDDLGQRTVKGLVLHRMQGTLKGTDQYFHQPGTKALTDYGIDNLTGEMIQWADPFGRMSGWASGKVSNPYGDGRKFLDKYAMPSGIGLNVVNRDQVSLEFGGWFLQPGEPSSREEPVNAICYERAAQFMAHFAHDAGIPWDQFPIAPQDGFSFLRWHQEYTIGTGKVCPGKTIMDTTDDLIARAKNIMQTYQVGGIPLPPPTIPPPPPTADPLPYAALFGTVDGFSYDPNGPVSKAWRESGQSTNRYPPLVKVVEHNGKRLFQFASGEIRS